jgi:hypothetical protein
MGVFVLENRARGRTATLFVLQDLHTQSLVHNTFALGRTDRRRLDVRVLRFIARANNSWTLTVAEAGWFLGRDLRCGSSLLAGDFDRGATMATYVAHLLSRFS